MRCGLLEEMVELREKLKQQSSRLQGTEQELCS